MLSRALEKLDRIAPEASLVATSSGEGGTGDDEISRLRGRILITLAMSRLALEGPGAAFAILDDVRRIAREHSVGLLGVQAQLQAGAIHSSCSEWAEALSALADVEPHLEELVPREQVSALLNRGLASVSLLDLDQGRRDLERACAISIEHGFRAQEFKARHNLGCVAYLSGDIPGALRLMSEAAAMDSGVGLAQAHLDHAKVLLDGGLVDEAEVVLHRGLKAARHDHQRMERGEIQLDLARAALLRGDVALARVRAGHAIRTFRSLHADGRTEEVELFGAAVDLGNGRRLARATAVAARWAAEVPVTPSERLAARIRAEVALARHDLETARIDLARLETDQPQPLGARLHLQLLAFQLASAEGDDQHATQILARAAERLAQEQGGVHSMEVRAGLAFHAARIRDADVASATDAGSLPPLFESAERWRAASHRVPPLSPSQDVETAALVGRLRQLRRDGLATPFSDAQREVVVLESEITARLRAVQGAQAVADLRPATFDQTATAASERDATIVTFHEIRDTVVRLTLCEGELRQSVLGPVADIAATTGRASADVRAAALARPSMAAFLDRARTRSLQDLDQTLLGGIEAGGTVVIVPTTALASLPWRALPSLTGHPVVAAPSVTAWVRRPTHATRTPSVIALAGPGLPRAREEAREVEKAWGRHTESPSATTPLAYAVASDVRAALASASVVHLAAHGHHVDQNPLFSSLDMGDGPVFAHELTAPLAAELVILSACDVGRSRGRVGDEPLGLAAALLSLGVQCVVAATSPVHDDVAAAAMADLHQRLVGGVDVATALRDTAAHVPGAESFCAYGNTWAATFSPNSPEIHGVHA